MGQVHGGLLLVACQHPDVYSGSTDVVDRLLNLVLDTGMIFLYTQIEKSKVLIFFTIMGPKFSGEAEVRGGVAQRIQNAMQAFSPVVRIGSPRPLTRKQACLPTWVQRGET